MIGRKKRKKGKGRKAENKNDSWEKAMQSEIISLKVKCGSVVMSLRR